MAYRSTSELDRRIDQLSTPSGSSNWGAILGDALKSYKANKLGKEREALQTENEKNQQREFGMLAQALKTGRTSPGYASATLEQFSPSDPAIRELMAKELMSQSTDQPSNVREWEYYSGLPEAQREQYLTMRRGVSPINLGGSFEIPSQTAPGTSLGSFETTLRPQDLPATRGAQTAAREAAETAAMPDQLAIQAQGAVNQANQLAVAPRTRNASQVLTLLDMAEPLLETATGSGLGALRDQIGGVFGMSGEAGQSAAQLKAIGGLLTSSMPRMEGPQGVYDVQLYQEMAGKIGDPTVPNDVRRAAMQTIRALNEKYANAPAPTAGAAPAGVRLRFNPQTGELE